MFGVDPKARAALTPGTLYAIAGEEGWIYYGQVTPNKLIGFFRHRGRGISDPGEVLAAPIMARVAVIHQSIGQALRAGHWKKLGKYDVHPELLKPVSFVQWPVGTLMVTIWDGGRAGHETTIDDPAIQDMEIIAGWDAVHHIPQRLTADFGVEPPEWHVGGPVRRQRRMKEEYAKRFPEVPWHQLPRDWVPTTVR
jgi:hypothetical protein